MNEAIKTDVIIIGGGPTGLSLACQLIGYGVAFAIVEKNESLTPYSKAIGVHARTLEIYEQIGLAQKALARWPGKSVSTRAAKCAANSTSRTSG